MSNYQSAKREIQNYIRARTPLVIIDSPERERVERMLEEIAREWGIRVDYYTDAKQVSSFNGEGRRDVGHDPLPYLTAAFQKNRNLTFALGDVRRIGDDNAYSREVLNILYLAREHNHTLLLITADPVWHRLAQFGMLTVLDYPDMEERTAQIEAFITTYRLRYPIEWQGEDVRMAATLLRGFSEIQIDNILSTTLVRNQKLGKDHLYELTAQKSRLYPPVPSIQEVRVDRNLAVSGLAGLKGWLEQKKAVFFAPEEALRQRDLTTPKGILLAGVPGCGKSLSAKMVAKEWELPLFRFDIGTIYDKWVGESEKRMKEALQFMDNVSPCVVWIDEIEKALSVSDTGNDTGKRVLGQFLFWLQESTSRVFLVATANEISLLPFELFRKGRFSELFFIDLPNALEREDAIRLYTEKSLHLAWTQPQLQELVALSQGFSYSDIEYAIKDVAQIALRETDNEVTWEQVVQKVQGIVPISQSNPDMVQKIRKWGLERAVPASGQAGGFAQ